MNYVVIIKDGSGNIFWPAWNLNLIGSIDPTQGYQIRMTVQEYLDITGTPADPATTIMNIPSGWSIMGYLHSTSANLETMLNPILSSITILKDGNGSIYWPAYGLNLIGNLNPGEGYQINLTQAEQFYYPALINSNQKNSIHIPQSAHYGQAQNTGSNMSLCIPLSAWDKIPDYGSEIGIFTQDGILVGSSIFENNNIGIAIWGDDEYSLIKDGLSNKEEFIIKLYNESETTIRISSWLQGNDFFAKDKMSVASKVITTGNNFSGIIEAFPIPASDKVSISFQVANDDLVAIELYNSLGKMIELYKKLHDGFGTPKFKDNYFDVMKELLKLRALSQK